MLTRTASLLLTLAATFAATAARAEERVVNQPDGTVKITPLPTDAKFLNPWTADLEKGFQQRANEVIKLHKSSGKGGYGSLYFEMEKSSYPKAMMDFLNGNRAPALDWLQKDDTEGYNAYTNMVDFYPSFTLKGQVRKYFFFGEYLDPAYKKKMFEGAKAFTVSDPATRKHPTEAKTKPGQGWMPNATGVCVDLRNTDNLQAMRETAVYLFAEETGNEETRKIYADKLIRNITNMFRVGMGEWDSNNYLGHTMTGYQQLYDFAKDPKMKLVGKAAMDYMTCTGAVKYYRGGYGGPDKRDYNHTTVHSGSAADHLGLYFGDYPGEDKNASFDNVHFITSPYRPPLAAVELAHKNLKSPVEILITHATYDALRKGASDPEDYETNYLARTYTFATLSTGTDGPGGDVNGFKLLATNTQRGADFFIANTTTNPAHICSAQYGQDTIGGNNVAQYRNTAIWLNSKADCPYIFYLPKTATVEEKNGVTFIGMEKTYIALTPINLKINGIDADLTEKVNFNTETDKRSGQTKKTPKLPDDQIISAVGTGGPVCGFAIEVGEQPDYANLAAFEKAVAAKSKLDTSAIASSTVAYTAADGGSVGLTYGGHQPKVTRNGKPHDWAKHTGLFVPADGSNAPIRLDWGSGALHVEAGGHTFDATMAQDGTYTFKNDGK